MGNREGPKRTRGTGKRGMVGGITRSSGKFRFLLRGWVKELRALGAYVMKKKKQKVVGMQEGRKREGETDFPSPLKL